MFKLPTAEIIGRIPVERFLDSRVAYLKALQDRAAVAREAMATSSLGFDSGQITAAEDVEFFAGRTAKILGFAAQALRAFDLEIGDGGLKIVFPEVGSSSGDGNS